MNPTSSEIRQQFLEFFKSKGHKIVPSAPLINKNDPTLLFINSGMAPFKDFFLGNGEPESRRIADTQKCLRVSGKHNDLEDVGMDGTHHTLFEMLGNWSFGDYFKEEAIAWSWELLTEVYGLPKDRLYATVFGGDQKENLASDEEALQIWLKYLPREHILYGNKKDNFWEMGEQGPCGPCSEIHIDLRTDEECQATAGSELVNKDHPRVIEIWNNVFMQFNRKSDGSLEPLPAKHVDTGMGFERLCLALQNKLYTYDTDVFTPFIHYIVRETGIAYTGSYDRSAKTDIAMRVNADHLRAICFVIADGQMPSNNGAGYVVRRILRRAVRYYYSFLGIKEPFLCRMVPLLADQFKSVFPELKAQEKFVQDVIREEERAFLRTLEGGLKRLEETPVQNGELDGNTAFELYDTFGVPIDLTRLIMTEKGYTVDEAGYEKARAAQQQRSRKDAQKSVGDWVELMPDAKVEFVGYDLLETTAKVIKYRTVVAKGQDQYQIVLNRTPFYAEGGGQVGDTGTLWFGGNERVEVLDTKKENDLIVHFVHQLPEDLDKEVIARVDAERRHLTENNHSATHLMHAALRQALGTHVQQRGSLVSKDYLRFDFSHFQKMTDDEIAQVEHIVNHKIRENIRLQEDRSIPIAVAKEKGAMMLFGEKYGEQVRMITFDEHYSRELCGGCHVAETGKIGFFKIVSEGAIAAGIRRIEAITADATDEFIAKNLHELSVIKDLLRNPENVVKAVVGLGEENKALRKQMEKLYTLQANLAKTTLLEQKETLPNGVVFIRGKVEVDNIEALKKIGADLRHEVPQLVLAIGAEIDGKAHVLVAVSDHWLPSKTYHAGNLVKAVAAEIKGGGGGQPQMASAGGTDISGIERAIHAVRRMIHEE